MSHGITSYILTIAKLIVFMYFLYQIYMLYKENIVYEGARGSRRKRKYMTSEQIESHLKSHGKHIKKLQEKVKELSKSTNLKKRIEELEDKTEDIPDN